MERQFRYINNRKEKGVLDNLSINTILIGANIICFILFSILIYLNANYLDAIAIKPSNILAGKFLWTFLTSMFMHGGFFHIFANMLSLFFIGSLSEKILGKKRYFLFYILAGLFAAAFFVASALVIPGDMNSYAVGASGALFGLVGFLMLITPNLPVYILFIPVPIKMKYAAPGMLIVLWLISIAANIPVGNTAHLGGLIAGLAYGSYLRIKYKKKTAMIKGYFS